MESVLKIEDLSKAFGGLQVTNDVNLYVNPNEIVAIIGPNGAGKTTLFNQITGYHQPDKGRVLFKGKNLIGLKPEQIVREGIGRAFQRSNIFPRLTVFENVQMAVTSYRQQELKFWLSRQKMHTVNERAGDILGSIGLSDKQDVLAGKLALGDQKRLEIGLALALEPELLLLDEPTAGMSQEETNNTVRLIERLVRDFNMTLLFTEHDMALVFGISQRIYVLNMGTIIAEGEPEAIVNDARVQEVYLGTDHRQVEASTGQSNG